VNEGSATGEAGGNGEGELLRFAVEGEGVAPVGHSEDATSGEGVEPAPLDPIERDKVGGFVEVESGRCKFEAGEGE